METFEKLFARFLVFVYHCFDRIGLLERIGRAYCYRLTDKGVKAALLFILFHKRVCGPLANSLFHHQPDENRKPASKLENAYYKADRAIQQVLDRLAA